MQQLKPGRRRNGLKSKRGNVRYSGHCQDHPDRFKYTRRRRFSRYVVNVVRIPPYRGLIISTLDDINSLYTLDQNYEVLGDLWRVPVIPLCKSRA
jgi:hypothetical protein